MARPPLRHAGEGAHPRRRHGSGTVWEGNSDDDDGAETIKGVQLYFDRALGKMLLYRFERQQYATVLDQHGSDARMSDIYGGEHLLRLLGPSTAAPARREVLS